MNDKTLEWLETTCYNCGQNIHASGGDPDWGLCWPCMEHQTNLAQADREYEAAWLDKSPLDQIERTKNDE